MTNDIETVNMSLRKGTENRASFPNDESMFKLLYPAFKNISKKWTMPILDRKAALTYLRSFSKTDADTLTDGLFTRNYLQGLPMSYCGKCCYE